jgi:hypothetical protein
MDAALILADRLLSLIRASGVSKIEAHAALAIAGETLPTISDISFRNDLVEQPESTSSAGPILIDNPLMAFLGNAVARMRRPRNR